MSLKSQIETAKDAVSKALITALQDKNQNAISDLFDAYNKLVSIQITETNKDMFGINNYQLYNIPCSMNDDVISFTGLGQTLTYPGGVNYPLYIMSELNMRFVEELDNGDKVITYYSVKELDNKFYYVYDGVNHGPYWDFDDAVEAAYEDLIPQVDMESL